MDKEGRVGQTELHFRYNLFKHENVYNFQDKT